MSDKASGAERGRTPHRGVMVVDFGVLLLLVGAMTAVVLALAGRDSGRAGSEDPPTPTVEVGLSEFSVSVSQFASASSGNVTFVVKNNGAIDHELIVLKTDTPLAKLPIVDSGDPPAPVKNGADKVDEGTSVGETGEPNLKPGQTRTFTVKNLAAGKYALVCNIAKHYGSGMRATFTVD